MLRAKTKGIKLAEKIKQVCFISNFSSISLVELQECEIRKQRKSCEREREREKGGKRGRKGGKEGVSEGRIAGRDRGTKGNLTLKILVINQGNWNQDYVRSKKSCHRLYMIFLLYCNRCSFIKPI